MKLDVGDQQQALDAINSEITSRDLNRITLAGFYGMELARAAHEQGTPLGPYAGLFEYVNLGEQCANVHLGERESATAKAIVLTKAAIRKARLSIPRKLTEKQPIRHVLVVGGGNPPERHEGAVDDLRGGLEYDA